jgi:hypothetical protein
MEIKKANKVNIVPAFTDAHINNTGEENKYHLHINTHPDLFPYYEEGKHYHLLSFSNGKTICSF